MGGWRPAWALRSEKESRRIRIRFRGGVVRHGEWRRPEGRGSRSHRHAGRRWAADVGGARLFWSSSPDITSGEGHHGLLDPFCKRRNAGNHLDFSRLDGGGGRTKGGGERRCWCRCGQGGAGGLFLTQRANNNMQIEA